MHTAWSRCRESYPFSFSAHTPMLSLLSGCPTVSTLNVNVCSQKQVGTTGAENIRGFWIIQECCFLQPLRLYPLNLAVHWWGTNVEWPICGMLQNLHSCPPSPWMQTLNWQSTLRSMCSTVSSNSEPTQTSSKWFKVHLRNRSLHPWDVKLSFTLHHRTMMPQGFSIHFSVCTCEGDTTIPCLKMWSFSTLRIESSNWAEKPGKSSSEGTCGG